MLVSVILNQRGARSWIIIYINEITVFTRISAAALIYFFRATSAALIRGRRLFNHCTRQIYFFFIFIQRYTFYLLIFLWTDTKLKINLELREKFTRWKNARVLWYRERKHQQWEHRGCGAYSRAALVNFFCPRCGAYSSKYGKRENVLFSFYSRVIIEQLL